MNLIKEKQLIRTKLKKKRNDINEEYRAEKSTKITNFLYPIDEFKQSNSIFCYISHVSEVETLPLINFILNNGFDLFVPKIINDTEMIALRLNNLSNLEPDNVGTPTLKSDELAAVTQTEALAAAMAIVFGG